MEKLNQQCSYFPRGLKQPKQGFRFSIDALLLACYPKLRVRENILDLGTGCGVVGFALLFLNKDLELEVTGVDISQEMIVAARQNAENLGIHDKFSAFVEDVRKFRSTTRILPESFDTVMLNPPYRSFNQGRMSSQEEKNIACFEDKGGLEDFVQGGAYALKNKGKFFFIYLAERLSYLFQFLPSFRLEPKRMRLVYSKQGSGAHFVLLETHKNGRPGLRIEPPLILYSKGDRKNELTEDALAYCPFLRCNK